MAPAKCVFEPHAQEDLGVVRDDVEKQRTRGAVSKEHAFNAGEGSKFPKSQGKLEDAIARDVSAGRTNSHTGDERGWRELAFVPFPAVRDAPLLH